MTAKQAIKIRCRDCKAGMRECLFEECFIKGLENAKKGADRTKAIREYCRWCMNNNTVSHCNSPDCSIYQYRILHTGGLKVNFVAANSA